MVIIGGVHIGIELAQQAKLLGYRVVVVDPRRAFGTAERFRWPMRFRTWPEQAWHRRLSRRPPRGLPIPGSVTPA
jgi:xanthine dehydrogenase accessory factor